jgi:hypothetical protein
MPYRIAAGSLLTLALALPPGATAQSPAAAARMAANPGMMFPTEGCLWRHSRTRECVLRLVSNAEIAQAKARRKAGQPDIPPANRWRLPGVVPGPVEPGQATFFECLAKTPMARPLADWPDDGQRLQMDAFARCTQSLPDEDSDDTAGGAGAEPGNGSAQDPQTEASMLLGALQMLMGANAIHFHQTGGYADDLQTLLRAGYMSEAPPLPASAQGTWSVSSRNIVSVALTAQGRETCRAFNTMLQLPSELGPGALEQYPAACASSAQGYRVHYRGSPAP